MCVYTIDINQMVKDPNKHLLVLYACIPAEYAVHYTFIFQVWKFSDILYHFDALI